MLRISVAIVVSVGALVFALTGGAPVSAQVDDPYATTTTRDCNQTPNHPDCRPPTTRDCSRTPNHPDCRGTTTTTTRPAQCAPLLSVTAGPSGLQVVLTIDPNCFPPGTLVTITFNGVPIGTITIPPGGQAALGGSGLAAISPANLLAHARTLLGIEAAQAARPALTFRVPDAAPGVYPVCAIADGFAPACTNFTITGAGGAGGVGGIGQGRGSGAGGGQSLTGAFGRTGLALLPWLIIAAAAVGAGYALKRPSRRRHRHSTSS